MNVNLRLPYSFLQIDQNQKSIQLLIDNNDEKGVYSEAYLEFSYENFSLKTPIIATIDDCQVDIISFTYDSININYNIGSGVHEEKIPSVTSVPDCGYDYTNLLLDSIFS